MEDEIKKLREKIVELNDQIDHCHKEIDDLRRRVKKLEEENESAAYFRSITPDSLSQCRK